MKSILFYRQLSKMTLLITLGIICFPEVCKGQINLLYDGAFEKHRYCPRGLTFSVPIGLIHWSMPTAGTTDYFNRCCRNKICGVPENYFGSIDPAIGSGYIGMILYNRRLGRRNYREYIQCQLVNQMPLDTVYYFRAYIALASKPMFSICSFGVVLHHEKIDRPKFQRVLNMPPVIEFDISQISETDTWVVISGFFAASINAGAIVLGNFNKDRTLSVNQITQNLILPYAYYYLDNVLLCKASSLQHHVDSLVQARTIQYDTDTKTAGVEKSNQSVCQDTLITLRIPFENDSAIISDSTFIYELVTFIEETHADSLLILGHTDATVNEISNLNLSLERAKAVQKALLRLSPHLVTEVYGMGSSRPVGGKEHTGSQKGNHRVEVYLKTQCQKAEKNNR